ncbi:hypothetical protein DFH28DRAFT_947287 [Melampsora americana]|nr:hypothetical protein DFH28DRAFT_947287 [Melampsora americana]
MSILFSSSLISFMFIYNVRVCLLCSYSFLFLLLLFLLNFFFSLSSYIYMCVFMKRSLLWFLVMRSSDLLSIVMFQGPTQYVKNPNE